jgi:hypothetical protein
MLEPKRKSVDDEQQILDRGASRGWLGPRVVATS